MKSGDARVALIGFPSVGKVLIWHVHLWPLCYVTPCHLISKNIYIYSFSIVSNVCSLFIIINIIISIIILTTTTTTTTTQSTLLSTLTSTESECASYEFTTLTCIPGVIQVVIHPSFFNPSTPIHPSIHFRIHSSTHLSIYPLSHPFIHPSIHSLIHSSTHPSIHPLSHPFIHSHIHSSTHPSIHPPIHPPTHLLTYPPIHSSIHPSTHPSIQYNGANIQLLDLPGIIEGAAQGVTIPPIYSFTSIFPSILLIHSSPFFPSILLIHSSPFFPSISSILKHFFIFTSFHSSFSSFSSLSSSIFLIFHLLIPTSSFFPLLPSIHSSPFFPLPPSILSSLSLLPSHTGKGRGRQVIAVARTADMVWDLP